MIIMIVTLKIIVIIIIIVILDNNWSDCPTIERQEQRKRSEHL